MAAEVGRFFFLFLDYLSCAFRPGLLGGIALALGVQGTPSELRDHANEHTEPSFPKAVHAGAQGTAWEDAGQGGACQVLSTCAPAEPGPGGPYPLSRNG